MSDLPDLPQQTYREQDLRVIAGIEGIRRRPAMYIGDMGMHGLHHLLFECLNNSIDEALYGCCTEIECTLSKDGSASVADNGPGIPLEPIRNGRTFLEQVLSEIHGPGYSDSRHAYRTFSSALYGVGIVPVNALSQWLSAEVHHQGHIFRANFERGVATSSLMHVGGTTQTGTKLHFKPDCEIFPEVAFDYERIRQRMQELSFLVPGVTLCLRDSRNSREDRFYHPDGLAAFVRHLNQDADVLFAEPFTHQQEFEGARIAVAFQPTNGFDTRVSSFVNSHACTEGTHILGFRAGLKQALAAYGKSHRLFLDRFPTIENYYEGMTAVISVWLEDPMYEGPTRFKLGNVEMASAVAGVVREGIESWAEQRPEAIHQIVEKAIAAAESNVS